MSPKSETEKNKKDPRGSNLGRVFVRWNFSEYGILWRNKTWVRGAIIIAGLLLLYAIWTTNYLFAVIIVLAGIIFYFQSFDKPRTVNCQISEDGIKIGRRLYDYREFDNFWIIYEPPEVKNLYLEFKNSVRPRLGIPLQDQNPIVIRQALKQYLTENIEREHEPFSDGLARWFKLHN